MPIFYFDIVDARFRQDLEGRILRDEAAVELEVRRELSEIVLNSSYPLRALVTVRDEGREIVATATIAAAIDLF